jgi:hypothetical protein
VSGGVPARLAAAAVGATGLILIVT